MRLITKLTLVMGIIALGASLALAHPGEVIQKRDYGVGTNLGGLDCSNAPLITCGFTANDTNVGATDNVQYYSCASWAFDAGEVAYELTVDAVYDVTIHLHPFDAGTDLGLFLLYGCDESMCLDYSDGYGDEEIVRSLNPGFTYYIVVDGFNGDDEGDYTLSVTCESGPEPPVELQGAEDCNDGVCLEPAVARAITGTTEGYINDYDPITGASGSSCTGYQAEGPDVVYEVGLSDGASLVVDLERVGYWDQALYLVTDCQDMDSCVAGSDIGNIDHIEWTHVGPPALYYVIIDGYSSTSYGEYILTYTHDGLSCDDPVANEVKSWGGVKALYR